jgi:hypothetical protein
MRSTASAYGDKAPDYSLNTISWHWQSEFLGVFAPKLTMQFRHICTAYSRKSQRGAPTARLALSFWRVLAENTQTPRANVERDTYLGLFKLQGRTRSWPNC